MVYFVKTLEFDFFAKPEKKIPCTSKHLCIFGRVKMKKGRLKVLLKVIKQTNVEIMIKPNVISASKMFSII